MGVTIRTVFDLSGLVIPRPLDLYSPRTKSWLLPLDFVFSIAWALELCVILLARWDAPVDLLFHDDVISIRVTHLEGRLFCWLRCRPLACDGSKASYPLSVQS